ncbi:MAG: hypothetical protein ACM3SX_09855 [Deltaproteobacteria bacterium]
MSQLRDRREARGNAAGEPDPTTASDSRSTSTSTLDELAPSAMRVPISLVCSET